MPKPVPPPPLQPSVEETRLAVAYLRRVTAVALAAFLLLASSYGPDAFFVRYGRSGAQSWNVWKALQLDEARLREGGRVAWLLGSSILRDSFDEQWINEELARRGSAWRVAKFGQMRGAAGMSAGMLEKLPVRAGDLVVHNVAAENFRLDWLDFSGLTSDRVSQMLEPSALWAISEWSVPERLEQAVAVPLDFYRYHDEYAAGVADWLGVLWWWELPRPRTKSFHLTYKKVEYEEDTERWRRLGRDARTWMGPRLVDFAPEQFNRQGLRRMANRCTEVGATLALVDIPPRQEYQALFLHDHVRYVWDAWRSSQPELAYFPQQPEDHYYDMKHPNSRGRQALSAFLVDWLDSGRPRGQPAPLEWPVPDYNHSDEPPPSLERWKPWNPS